MNNLIHAITPFNFAKILGNKLKISFVTLFMLVTLPTVFFLIVGAFQYGIPFTRNAEQKLITFVDDMYPDDLEVNIQDGKVDTNVSQPYLIQLPQKYQEPFENEDGAFPFDALLTIDTTASVEDFDTLNTYALLTEDHLVYYRELNYTSEGEYQKGEVSFLSLEDVDDFIVNQTIINQYLSKFLAEFPLQLVANVLLAFMPVIILVGGIFMSIFVLFFTTLLTYIISRIRQDGISFKKMFVYTLAASFMPVFAYRIISVFIDAPDFSTWLSQIVHVITLAFAYIGLEMHSSKKTLERGEIIQKGLLMPLFLFQDIVDSKRSGTKKLLYFIFALVFVLTAWTSVIFSGVELLN